MSEGNRVSRRDALTLAEHVFFLLRPHCERVEIAGSLRRCKPDVGDIELVMIPTAEHDLFGGTVRTSAHIKREMIEAGYTFIKGGEHLHIYEAPLCHVELYITTPEQFGVILTIRTGSSEFSHRLVTPRNQGGLMPSYLHVKDGRVWNKDTALDTYEERDVFQVMNIPWIEPEKRI